MSRLGLTQDCTGRHLWHTHANDATHATHGTDPFASEMDTGIALDRYFMSLANASLTLRPHGLQLYWTWKQTLRVINNLHLHSCNVAMLAFCNRNVPMLQCYNVHAHMTYSDKYAKRELSAQCSVLNAHNMSGLACRDINEIKYSNLFLNLSANISKTRWAAGNKAVWLWKHRSIGGCGGLSRVPLPSNTSQVLSTMKNVVSIERELRPPVMDTSNGNNENIILNEL